MVTKLLNNTRAVHGTYIHRTSLISGVTFLRHTTSIQHTFTTTLGTQHKHTLNNTLTWWGTVGLKACNRNAVHFDVHSVNNKRGLSLTVRRVFCLILSNTGPLSQVHFQIVPQPFRRAPSIQYDSYLYAHVTHSRHSHTQRTHTNNHNTYNTRSLSYTWWQRKRRKKQTIKETYEDDGSEKEGGTYPEHSDKHWRRVAC